MNCTSIQTTPIARLPERFDYAPIDTCEEAMFSPGSDMLVRALVGDDANVHVTFTALGHTLDYVQSDRNITGTIDGRAFVLGKDKADGHLKISGSTSAGPIEVSVEQGANPSHVEGHAGQMGYRHILERKDGSGSGLLANINGKFD